MVEEAWGSGGEEVVEVSRCRGGGVVVRRGRSRVEVRGREVEETEKEVRK